MPKTYKVMYENNCVGVVSFTGIDTGMGVALGEFTPTPAYEEVRPIFRLFTKAMLSQDAQQPYDDDLNAYFHRRDDLHLHVETEEGQFIPYEWIHIIDLSSEIGDYEIEIKLSERSDVEKLSQEVTTEKQ